MIRSRAVVAAAISIALAMIVLPAAVAAQTTALTVADASVAAGSTTLTVPAASLAVDGYIVVHEGDADSFGDVAGSSALLPAGTYSDIAISLDRPIADGEYLWPMLHSEDNGNGVYDDPGTDAPIADGSAGNASFGGVVTFPMQLSILQAVGLTVADASVSAGATQITVPAAGLPVDGYIVIHEGDATSFGGVVGSSSLLTAGSHTNVTIQLDRPIENGEYLWPMLHSEDNGNGVYDDPGTDAPIADAGTGNADFGGVVTFPMQLTVESAPAAAPAGNAGLSSDSDGSAPWLAIAAAIVGVSVLLFAGRTFAGRRS